MIRKLSVARIFPILIVVHVCIEKAGCTRDCPTVSVQIPATNYPNATRDENERNTYPGNKIVKDPYRWMENIDSDEISDKKFIEENIERDEAKKFIEAENAISRPYLDKAPNRAEIEARYKELDTFAPCYSFFRKGQKYFFIQKEAAQDQPVIFVQNSPTGEAKVLLDPNKLSKDGTVELDVDSSTISDDGMVYGYKLTKKNSDWTTVKFKHVEQGDIYHETLTRIKDSPLTFAYNTTGIFYSGYLDHKGKLDESDNGPLKNQKLYYHKLGTEQSKDIVVAEFPDKPDGTINGRVTGGGKYLVVTVSANSENDNNLVYVADLAKINYQIKGKLDLIPVMTKDEAYYSIITAFNTTFVFITKNQEIVNRKLVSFDITDVAKTWKDLVPEDKKNELEFANALLDKYLVLSYAVDFKDILQIHDITTGKLIKKLDTVIGTALEPNFYSDPFHGEFYFTYATYISQAIIYQCDASKPSFDLKIFRETKLKNFDREKYTIEEVFFKNKDGAQLPMLLVHKKDLQMNGNNPVLMQSNGGYNDNHLPSPEIKITMFVGNFDGIHAIVNGISGDEYYQPQNKPKVIADFQAAVDHLIAQKYTKPNLISVYSEGDRSVIVAAAINQRPDLFGAVVVNVAFLDMLRLDKVPDNYIWFNEFGSPTNATDFPTLFKYSPLNNIKIPTEADKQYPAIMAMAADDDLAPISHSLKYMATLQHEAKQHPNQKNPFILTTYAAIDITQANDKDTEKDIDKRNINQNTDLFSFIMLNTGIKFNPLCQ